MIPISIEKFMKLYMKNNPSENKQMIVESLKAAIKAKNEGASCGQCGESIWAMGTGIAGWNACFTCMTGEADDSKDYEVVM